MASSCCPVCYKVGGSSASGTPGDFGGGGGHDPVTAEAQQRFFKLIQSFSLGQVGADEKGKDGDGAAGGGGGQQKFPFPLEQFQKFEMICCVECSKIMEGVCERHHQLETAQLSLNRKLEKLKRIMTGTQGSSMRLGEHLKVTGNEGAGDYMIGAFLMSRASLLAICSGKVTCSFSSLDIPRLEFDEEALSVSNTLSGHVGGELDLPEMDLGEDGGSDQEEAQPVKRRRCETPQPPIGDGTLASENRKGTNRTQSEDEEEAASTSTGTPRTIARERNNESPPTLSAGLAEAAPAELNIIGNANLDPIPVNVACGLRNDDRGSTSSPTAVVPQTEDATIDPDDDGSDDSREEETQHDLEGSIKKLYREDTQQQGDPQMSEGKKQELISKLELSRQEEADLERMARRIAWREEVRSEMKIKAEIQEIMEGEEVEEKPSMSTMSMEWREAFKIERAGFLFPQALSAMLKSKLTPKPDPKMLLYRCVNKAAKESVDALLSNDPLFPQRWIDAFNIPHYNNWVMGISHFDNEERAKSFTSAFNRAEGNPFFTRNFDINISPETATCDEFLEEIRVILRRWGRELWSASLEFENEMSAQPMHDLLVTWLKLMPNLRVLRLKISGQQIMAADVPKLREHMAKNPLPDMPHLAHIAVGSSSKSAGSLIAHALLSKYNSGLERMALELNMDFYDGLQINDTISNCAPPATAEGSFPALDHFHVCYRDVASVTDVRKILKNFNKWQLPVKRLELELHNAGIKGPKGYYPMFLLDNKALAAKGVFLEMPQLEELTLILYYRIDLRTFDFLLPCKGLKVLTVHNTRVEASRKPRRNQKPPEDKGIFQFTTDPADKDRLYQSPIWKLLPELKRIVIRSVSLSRYGEFDKVTEMQEMSVGELQTYQYTREEYLQQ